MAPRPTPVGWEQDPVTDGSFKADNTNTKPPARPNNTFLLVSPLMFLLILLIPRIIKGIDNKPHIIAHLTGKKPSIMCMAWPILGVNNNKDSIKNVTLLFFIFFSPF